MRILAEMATILAASFSIIIYSWNHFFNKPRKQSNLEHVRQLEDDNKELDDILNRMKGEN